LPNPTTATRVLCIYTRLPQFPATGYLDYTTSGGDAETRSQPRVLCAVAAVMV